MSAWGKRVSAAVVWVLLILNPRPASPPADVANPDARVTIASAGEHPPERFQMRRDRHQPSPLLSARRSVARGIPMNSVISTASWYNDYPQSCDGHAVLKNVKFWTAYAAPFGAPLPCGTRVRVTLVDNPSQSVDVLVLDRGPCREWEYRPKRCVQPIRDGRFWRRFDLSRAAFVVLTGGTSAGVARVRWSVLASV